MIEKKEPDTPLIIYEDNHILAAVKEPGILSQADITRRPDMVSLIKDYIAISRNKPGNVWLGLLHRLDQPASGIMVFALTSKAAGRMAEAFRDNQIGKYYLALVNGRPTENSGLLRDYLSRERRGGRYYVTTAERGNESVLKYRVLSTYKKYGFPLSLLLVQLITGRPHQIRIQFQSRRLPLLGDRRYGMVSPLDERVPTLALHALQLEFDHPVKRSRYKLRAPLYAENKEINPSFKLAMDHLNANIELEIREITKMAINDN